MLDKIVSYIEKYAIKLTEWCWHTRVKILRERRKNVTGRTNNTK